MKVLFTARHFSASESLQSYCEQAVQKLSKFHDGIQEVEIVASPDANIDSPQHIEVSVKVPGTVLIASESSETYETAINKVVDNLKRQIKKYKDKQLAHK